jgi:hypothetical protein
VIFLFFFGGGGEKCCQYIFLCIQKLFLFVYFISELILVSFCFRLNEFLEFADDIAIDVPKFWPYIAEFIGEYARCTLLLTWLDYGDIAVCFFMRQWSQMLKH